MEFLTNLWNNQPTIVMGGGAAIVALIGMYIFYSISLSLRGIELEWLSKALIGISVLTLPHTVVVCWMDRKQKL